jgi:hypothetical protein
LDCRQLFAALFLSRTTSLLFSMVLGFQVCAVNAATLVINGSGIIWTLEG